MGEKIRRRVECVSSSLSGWPSTGTSVEIK
jgi:hypothetical protein